MRLAGWTGVRTERLPDAPGRATGVAPGAGVRLASAIMIDKGSVGGRKPAPITKIVLRCPTDAKSKTGEREAWMDVWRDGVERETSVRFVASPSRGDRTGGLFGEDQPPTLQAYSFLLWMWSRASDADAVEKEDVQRLLGWHLSHERSVFGCLDRLATGSEILEKEKGSSVVRLLIENIDVEPKEEERAILEWAGVLPSKLSERLRRKLLQVLSTSSAAARDVLARCFALPAPSTVAEDRARPGQGGTPAVEALADWLLDGTRTSVDLVHRLRKSFEAPENTSGVRTEIGEVARLVLPNAADVRAWVQRVKNGRKVLILPVAHPVKIELHLASFDDRAMQLGLRPRDASSADQGGKTELASAAVVRARDFVSGSAQSIATKHFLQELTRYFATRVLFRSPHTGEIEVLFPATDDRLRFKTDAAFEQVRERVNGSIAFHATAEDDDLLPRRLEVDQELFERLQNANDDLLRAIESHFPDLHILVVTAETAPDTALTISLVKILASLPRMTL